ncbi:uncharacterized protein RCO7_09376 [Rhynchosporium graminicola]|uniref:Uncharacterized protein n=1 Tax=Rhynchosporium graminicola TaxID=2792576 RepID=A0A1E1KWT8_9HELO|nr:uncharacterized protein RCO7_09376 [Rhynchosporium commune]
MHKRLPPVGRNDQESQMPSSPIEEPEDNYFHDAMEHSHQHRGFDQEYQLGDRVTADNATSQERGVDQDDQLGDLDKIGNADSAAGVQDSNPSVVGETQTVALEIDTQAESNQSLIEDTQYIPLEIDTQAAIQSFDKSTTALDSTKSGKSTIKTRDVASLINSNTSEEPRTLPTGPQMSRRPAVGTIKVPGLIERPAMNDAGNAALAFKFGLPPKLPVVWPHVKTPQPLVGAKISTAAKSGSAIEPDGKDYHLRLNVPQDVTAGHPPISKDEMKNFRSLSTNVIPSMPPAVTQNASHVPHDNINSLLPSSQRQSTPKDRASGTGLDTASAPLESTKIHPLSSQKQTPSKRSAVVTTSKTSDHSEVSPHEASSAASSTRISDAKGYDESKSQPSQSLNMGTKGGQKMSGQNLSQRSLLALSPAVQNDGSSRKRSLASKLSAMPFPEASSRPVRLHDRSASDQWKTNFSATVQAGNVPSTSEAICNEKRTRTSGPSTTQVHGGHRKGGFSTVILTSADAHDVLTQHIDLSENPGCGNDRQDSMPASRLNLHPIDIAEHIEDDEKPTNRPPQYAQKYPSVTVRPHASPHGSHTESTCQAGEQEDHEVQSYRPAGHEQPETGNEDSISSVWEPVLDVIPQNEYSESLHPKHAQEFSQTLSRAESEARPNSRRSNRDRPMTRPVRADDLISRPSTARSCHVNMSKVSRLIGQQTATSNSITASAPKGARTRMGFQEILEMAQEFEDLCCAYQVQEKTIAIYESKIMQLEQSNAMSSRRVEALDTKNTALAEKMQKFTDLNSKYKKHMNEVVNSQSYLKEEATRIQSKANEAHRVINKQRAIYEKIEKAIKEARDMRGSAEKFQNLNQELNEQKSKLLAAQNHTKRLQQVNERLHQDNNGFKAALDTEKERIQTLQNELDRKSHDFSREMRAKEQLEKQLENQTTVYRELVDHLKKLPESVSEQLQKKNGVLASILSAGNVTDSRINEMVSVLNQLRDNDPKAPTALVQLIEDLSSRLESREQNSDADMASSKDATTKALEEIKETVKQLRLDETTQSRYQDRISRLEKTNETLTVDKLARDTETQSLTQQLEQLQRELVDCQDRLKAREGELTEARAIPRDDPLLSTRIKELESARTVLESQLDTANQEISKAKDEVKSAREVAARKDQQVKGFEQKLNNAQKTVKAFNEVRDSYIAAKENEKKAACHELAKKAESQKETLRVKLESQINNARHRHQEKESELVQAKQKLQEIQTQLESQINGASNQNKQRAAFIGETKEQFARVQQLIEKAPSQKVPAEFFQELQSIKVTTKESHSRYDLAKDQLFKTIANATQEQRRIEEKVEKVGALNVEIQDLKEQCSGYQGQLEELSRAAIRHQQPLVETEFRREYVNATPNLPSPATNVYSTHAQMPKVVQITPRTFDNDGSENMRRSIARNAQHKSFVQPAGTSQLYSKDDSMVTPRGRVSLGLHGSISAARSSSQQHVPASQNSDNSIKPFSTLTSFSTPPNSVHSHLNSLLEDVDKTTGSAIALTTSKTSERRISTTQSNTTLVGTSSGQNAGANGRPITQRSSHELNVDPSEILFSSSKITTRTKSVLKQKVNPHFAAENSKIETTLRQEGIPNLSRQTLGMGDIRGVKSGNVPEESMYMAQDGKQLATGRPQEQLSPLAGDISRFRNQKRPHEMASSGPRKRAASMQRHKLSRF